MKCSPQTEALAYRIWALARSRGWDMHVGQIASELEVDSARVRRVVQVKGWQPRLRSNTAAEFSPVFNLAAVSLRDIEKEVPYVR